MPGSELLIAFFMATLVFAVMPGPGMLYTAARTLSGGRRVGWQAAIGLHIGGYAHVVAAAFGLTLLFEAVPVLYAVLKAVGAVYLIYLGLRVLLAKPVYGAEQATRPRERKALWQSVLVEVMNPKTALFFLAFLPQFTDPAAAFPIWVQFLILGTVVNVMFSAGDLACVFLADRVVRVLSGPGHAAKWMQRAGGGILVGLGVKLALSRN